MNVFNKFTATLLITSQIGCATTIKGKVLQNTLIAGAAGATYGHSLENHKNTHATMYGGAIAAIAAIATVYYLDPDAELENERKRSREISKAMDNFDQNKTSYHSKPSPALNNYQAIPERYRKKISPGEWNLIQIDDVEQIDENRLVRKTEILELTPPQINSGE